MIQGRTRTSIREGPCFRILGWHISASCQKRGGGIASPKIKTTFSVEQAPLPTTGKRWGSSSVERGGIHRKIIFKSPVRKNIYNNKEQLVNELFYSPIRIAVDWEIRRVIMTHVEDKSLQSNLLYHFHLDEEVKPSLEFSKRLRAYLCYLFAQESAIPFDEIVPLATTMELLHNSTLAIDDIQDNGISRCGRDSLWIRVGRASAINAAYFLGLYSMQYYQEKRRQFNYYDYTTCITQFIERLLCGQQKDLDSDKIDKTVENYRAIVYGKTGALLNMACLLGSMPYSYCAETALLITEFANSLAICYQILDDLNDVKKDLTLDQSNIYFFVKKSGQTDKQIIQEIDRIREMEAIKLMKNIHHLHVVGILKTNSVDQFVNELIL